MLTGAEREVRQPDRHHSSRLTRGETSVGGLRAVVLLQFYVSSIALVYTVLMLRKSTNRIHSDKVTKFMGSGSISKAVTVHFATACRPSVTVLVEIRAGYLGCMPVCILWRHAGMHVAENSHVNSWRHAGLHAARHFLFLESYWPITG